MGNGVLGVEGRKLRSCGRSLGTGHGRFNREKKGIFSKAAKSKKIKI